MLRTERIFGDLSPLPGLCSFITEFPGAGAPVYTPSPLPGLVDRQKDYWPSVLTSGLTDAIGFRLGGNGGFGV
jgi:hypothetical protein